MYEHRMIAFGADFRNHASALVESGHPVDVLDKLAADGWEVVGVTFTFADPKEDPSLGGVALIRRPVQP
jgi:hypothetical protein